MTEHYAEKNKKKRGEKKEKKKEPARVVVASSLPSPRLSNAATHIKKSLNMIKFQVWI